MSTVTLANHAVLRGHISLPIKGSWWAHLEVDHPKNLTGAVTLKSVGGLELEGTIVEPCGVDQHVAHINLVGGKAGLSKIVSGAYRSAKLKDPLDAIMRASGEALASEVSAGLLSMQLAFWTAGKYSAWRALDDLTRIASEKRGTVINWRILPSGKIWLGEEAWRSTKLPKTDVIRTIVPSEGRTVLGVQTLSLLPGVELTDTGKVRRVDHWITPSALTTWVWV